MALAQVIPSFKYTRKRSEWPGAIFTPLLMRHGRPPSGVKWYGEQHRLYIRSKEAQDWEQAIIRDCEAALDCPLMSHYADTFRERQARHVKNKFIEWCRENMG